MTGSTTAVLAAALALGGALLLLAKGGAAIAVPAAAVDPSPRPAAAGPVQPAPAAPTEGSPSEDPSPGTAPAPAAELDWPLQPVPAVVRPFRLGPERWSPGHRGVDLAARPDQTVLSAAEGVIGFAGQVAGRPVVTVLHADGLRTTYEPVTASVLAGQQVTRGQALGTITPQGSHCDPVCLHWGALRGTDYLDPLNLVRTRRRPPVLLPLALPWPSSASLAAATLLERGILVRPRAVVVNGLIQTGGNR